MRASESSSWPSPRTSDTNGAGAHGDGGPDLRTAASNWSTPRAEERQQYNSKDGYEALSLQTKNWATPQAHDAASPKTPEQIEAMRTRGTAQSGSRHGVSNLNEQASLWQTPAVADADGTRATRGAARSDELLLNGQARETTSRLSGLLDPTTAPDGRTSSPDGPGSLPQLWQSPMASTNRKSRKALTASTENGRRSGGGNSSTPGLEQQAEILAGVLPAEMDGTSMAPRARASLHGTELPGPPMRLNVLFEEWLMGWPIGTTGFGLSATAWSAWRRRMLFELSWLGHGCSMPDEAPTQELDIKLADVPVVVRGAPLRPDPEGLAEAREVFDNWRTWAVVQGDAYEVMAHLPDLCADSILVDPPYNIAPYSTGNIKAKWRATINNDIAEWDGQFSPKELLAPVKRLLKPDGNFASFCAYNLLGEYHAAFDPEFDTFNFAVWKRTNPPPKLRRQGFLNSCELIVFAWNKGHRWNFTKQTEMHNFVETPLCGGKERLRLPDGSAVSPTQKPLAVCRWLIEKTTRPGDLILDGFAGVGSMGVAAVQLGRRYIGIERDPSTCAAAMERLSKVRRSSLPTPSLGASASAMSPARRRTARS